MNITNIYHLIFAIAILTLIIILIILIVAIILYKQLKKHTHAYQDNVKNLDNLNAKLILDYLLIHKKASIDDLETSLLINNTQLLSALGNLQKNNKISIKISKKGEIVHLKAS